MKIAQKISLSILALAVALTCAACAVSYVVIKGELEREIFERLSVTCDSRRAHVETYLAMLRVSAGQLSKSVVLEEFLKKPSGDPGRENAFDVAMTSLARTKDANPAIFEFLLCDAAGRVVASSEPASIGQDKSADSLFTGGRSGIFIKDAYHSRIKGINLLAVSAPITDSKTGRFLGVIAARVKLDDLYGITTDRDGLGRTGDVYIINKYGYMITPSRFLKETFLKQKVDISAVTRCVIKGSGGGATTSPEIVLGRNYAGMPVVMTRDCIPSMGWCIIAEMARSEAFSPLGKLAVLIAVILLMNPVLAWAIGRIAANIITGPIHRLHRGAEIIGSGNLDYRVGTPSKDEIGQLSRAFDAMTADLRGKIVTVDALNKEAAERRSAEASLAESEAKYRALFDASADAIMLLDPVKGFFDANPATLALFGCTREQFVRQHPMTLSPPYQPDGLPTADRYKEVIAAALEKGSNFFEWKHKRLDGREFFATVLLTRMELKGKTVLQATVRDISERKESDARLSEVIDAKARFVSTVSHEIRAPLTAIKEGIGIVLEGAAGELNAEQENFLSLAKRNVDRLSRLINDVLDYQKLESGKANLYMKKADINAMATEVARLMAPVAKKKPLDLALSLAPGPLETICDPDRITQVILNLVNNAIRYTRSGLVTVSTAREGAYVAVSVRDTGPGIEKADVPKLFKGYSQLGFVPGTKDLGTGLGLAISKSIIEEHNGSIWAEAEPGRGSEFKFRIPLKTRYRVMFVDDEEGSLEFCRKFLERAGYEVVSSREGSQTVELARKYRPDVLVLGSDAPQAELESTIGRLRMGRSMAGLPVIAASSYAERLKKLREGYEDFSLVFIAKPLKFEELLSSIQLLLKQSSYGKADA